MSRSGVTAICRSYSCKHYYGGSSRTWKYVTARLAPTFHTIAIDHRGWGKSDAPVSG